METETRKTVQVTITVEVPVREWCDEYGVTAGQVRKDVAQWLSTAADSAPVPMRTVPR